MKPSTKKAAARAVLANQILASTGRRATQSEITLLQTLRDMPSDKHREFILAVAEILVELQHDPGDLRLYRLWLKASRKDRRSIDVLLRTLRTGAWRREAARLTRSRLLRLADVSRGAK